MTKKEKSIDLFTRHYRLFKDRVNRIDAGETIAPDSVTERNGSVREECVKEANICVDRLADLGNFEFQKIC